MNQKILNCAKANIDAIAQENDITTHINQGNLYIEVRNGRNFKLSEDEVFYQAEEYLKAEIESLKHI